MILRPALLGALFALVAGCASGADPATGEDDFTAADFAEDAVLPYAGDWLDAPKALAGVGQFDRLKATVHDEVKCSTMVAVGAAVVGGEARFIRLLDTVAKRRDGKNDDLEILARVRGAIAGKKLTPRHLHELTEVIVRAYKLMQGALDEQIAEMIRAEGYEPVKVGSAKPHVLVDHLAETEIVPLGVVSDNVPHITLIWKDARGTVRLYDSDDVHGPHVMPRGSVPYNARMNDPQSSWELREKYR
jgi:hypothetical protein